MFSWMDTTFLKLEGVLSVRMDEDFGTSIGGEGSDMFFPMETRFGIGGIGLF